jgi:methyl-accepting chemotaxis protein
LERPSVPAPIGETKDEEEKGETLMKAQLLRSSFDLISPEKFVHAFYIRLFERYPALRPLFVQDISIQERSLAATLEVIVQAAEQQEDLSHMLYLLGKRHAMYGVLPEHYPLLGTALLETFSLSLGERFTPEMRQAWTETYDSVSAAMQKAAAEL